MLPIMDVVPHCSALLSYVSCLVMARGNSRILQWADYLETLKLKRH